MSCAEGEDKTEITRVVQQNAPADSPGAEPAADRDSDGEALPPHLSDAGGPEDDPKPTVTDAGLEPPAFDVPCIYQIHWIDIQLSHEGCTTFSPLILADYARWDGERLNPLGSGIDVVAGHGEDFQACALGAENYRYAEAFQLTSPPPAQRCEGLLTATYRYDECLVLYGTSGVCSSEAVADPNDPDGGPDKGTCSVRAVATLVPLAAAADAGAAGPDAGEGTTGALPGDAGVPECLPLSTQDGRLTRPVAIGEPCYATRFCEAGSYCQLLPDEAPLSCQRVGTCQPAPRLADCSDEEQASATCNGGCQRTLPLRGGERGNPCKVRALMGLTVFDDAACPE